MARAPILVIGCRGQMAQALVAEGGDEIVSAGRPDVDLRVPSTVDAVIARVAPRTVINAAAYTAVDKAESEMDEARRLNVEGPASLARACAAADIPLVHLSTDCVFDGKLGRPYRPDDASNPLGIYGRTKLDGELAAAAAWSHVLNIRVSWIFSRFGSNFVTTMLRLAETREQIDVVCDQWGCPTHAPDLAKSLLQIADAATHPGFDNWGTYHLAGRGETGRAEMAELIFAESRAAGGPSATVRRVLTRDYPTPAKRPLNARLDTSLTEEIFGVSLPDWRAGLEQTVKVLLKVEQRA